MRQKEGTDGLERVRTVEEGRFFGHEGFLRGLRGGTWYDASQLQTGMRALTECSMYLLTESTVLHLVSTPRRKTCRVPGTDTACSIFQ